MAATSLKLNKRRALCSPEEWPITSPLFDLSLRQTDPGPFQEADVQSLYGCRSVPVVTELIQRRIARLPLANVA